MAMKRILLGALLAAASQASFIYGPGIFVNPSITYGHGFWPNVISGTQLTTFGVSFTLTGDFAAGTTLTITGTRATFDTGNTNCALTQGGTAVAGFTFTSTSTIVLTMSAGPALPAASGEVVITCTAGLLAQTAPDSTRVTFTVVTDQTGGTDPVVPNSPGWIILDGMMNNPGSPTCFPGEATVDFKPLATYDSALGFLHATQGPASFLTLEHEHGELRVSANHLVFNKEGRAVAAEQFKLGDELVLATGIYSRVINICQDTTNMGMFAPLTPSGTILVDGTMASNYGTVGKLNIPHAAMHASFTLSRMFPFLQATDSSATSETVNPLAYVFHDILKLDKLL